MSKIFRQLELLCWKNYVSKKRNLLRLIFEILLPIILFLVLVFIRSIGNRKTLPDCYFKPKAMPSAGDVAFFQGFYCSLNNTCEDSTANASLSIYDSSVVSSILRAVEEAFDLRSPEDSESTDAEDEFPEFMNNTFDPGVILKYIDIIRSAIRSDDELKRSNFGSLVSSLVLPSEKDGSKKHVCGLLPFGRKARAAPDAVHIGNSSELFANYTGNDTDTGWVSASSFSIDAILDSPILKILDKVLCGKNVPHFARQILSLAGQDDKAWERRKEEFESQSVSTSASDLEFQEPAYEADTSPFCNNVMRNLEMSLETRIVWKLFKPFLRGKIVFAPSAPAIIKLMSQINETFAKPYHVLSDLLKVSGRRAFHELDILRNNENVLRRLALSDLGSDLLMSLGLKADGDNEKAKNQDVKAFRKILDGVITQFNRDYEKVADVSWRGEVFKYMECIDWSRVIGYETAEEAEEAALDWLKTERLWALVEFVGVPVNATELPPGITYKIRTGIERTHGTFQIRDRIYRPKVRRHPLIDLKHVTGGWAYIQNLIESEIIRQHSGRKHVPGIYLQQTPYPCHIKDMFRESITRTLPMFMIMSWIFIFAMLIRRIVWEKEKRVTQTLRVMGVGKAPYWLAWFLDAFVPMFVVSFFLSFILIFGKIIPFTSFFVVWFFMISFILPTITLAFLVSTLFSRASFAAAVAGFLYLLLYIPYPPLSQFEEAIHPNFKISLCFVSNIAFGLGCTWLANMEELAIGGQLSNMHISPVPGNPISMTLIMGMLALDALIYLLLALYIENVFPGGDLPGRPFYFIFTRDYWFGSRLQSDYIPTPNVLDPSKFEAEPLDVVVGVMVRNLVKKYGNKVALNNLSINFYENQITSFLGHNGAGKSTAVSIMTGLASATFGDVHLYGENLNNDPEIKNRNLGVCSQENVLLEDLTVEEHLYFFACMKGGSDESARKDAEKIMLDVGISSKRSTQAKFLSGGTQRKLCVAIALIGGSRVIFLDEPTAGVDPSARRAIWDLLIKYKKGRTIVLTTHFMDEADLLSDRIAILSKGELMCCGSPVFLKTQLGRGYYLTIECNVKSELVGRSMRGTSVEETDVSKELICVIRQVIAETKLLEQIGSEIVFVFPHQDSKVYSRLFSTLENFRSEGRIKSYGISDTSLEEIFLKLTGEIQDEGCDYDYVCPCFTCGTANYNPVAHSEPKDDGILPETQPVERNFCRKNIDHFLALTRKRALHHVRNYKALIMEVVVPAVFVALSVYLASLLPSLRAMPPLDIDISAYAPSHIFYSMDVPNNPRLQAYEKELLGPLGLGTKCAMNPGACNQKNIADKSLAGPVELDDTSPCPCNHGRFSCSSAQQPHVPPWTEMSSGDRLYNLTGRNISNWVVKTELEDSYIRYGGLSFGYPSSAPVLGVHELIKLFHVPQLAPFLSAFEQGRSGESVPEGIFETLNSGVESISANKIVDLLMTACSKSIGDELLKNADINDNIIIWYNNRGWIAGIAFMNAVSNLVLRASLPEGVDHSKYYIKLINHPLPITARQFEDELDKQANVSLLRAMVVLWALAFIPATYAVYLIAERVSGFKHLQIITGVSRLMYWIATFFWDFCLCLFTVFILIIILLCYRDDAFVGDGIFGFTAILTAYSAVSVTFVYPLTFMFEIPSSGFVGVSTFNIFVGMITLLTTFVLSVIQDDENPFYLNSIFMIFPQFCLGKALLNMSVIAIRVKTLATFGVTEKPDYFAWETTSKFLIALVVQAVFFFLLALVFEFDLLSIERQVKDSMDIGDEDTDVKQERDRVLSGAASNDVLVLRNLTKWFPNQKRPAVKRLCLGVNKSECFGLLGLNGAGKTTVFKMLTGGISPTKGSAMILGESINDSSELPLGYCPQSNALDPFLTCEEHLTFFAKLHGLKGKALEDAVVKNLERLGIEAYRRKMARTLSGGNKRKLNTAIALVGEPQVLLLDEPTSGMDPRARRLFWQCIQKCVQHGKSVVLSSHSMEECQTLCTRLSILVNGEFKCLGTCQHLKNKFDEGYSVITRISSVSSLSKVKTFLCEKLPTIGSPQVNYLQVKLRLRPGASLADVFSVLDDAKVSGLIRDYSISQTTLEQIFLSLVESQTSVDNDQVSSGFNCCWNSCKRQAVEIDNAPAQNGKVRSLGSVKFVKVETAEQL